MLFKLYPYGGEQVVCVVAHHSETVSTLDGGARWGEGDVHP